MRAFKAHSGIGRVFAIIPSAETRGQPHAPAALSTPTGERVPVTFWVPEYLRRNILLLPPFEPRLRCPRCTQSSRHAQKERINTSSPTTSVMFYPENGGSRHNTKAFGISSYGNLIFDHLQHKQYREPPSKSLGYQRFNYIFPPLSLASSMCV